VVGVAGAGGRGAADVGVRPGVLALMPGTLTPAPPVLILLLATDGVHTARIAAGARALLAARLEGTEGYEVFDVREMLETLSEVFRRMEVIVSLVIGVALLVGGVGIMNVMLMSARERLGEIGIRRALGASHRAVQGQLLGEAALVAGAGGLAGALAGAAATLAIGHLLRGRYQAWETTVAVDLIGAALVGAALVGLLFGALPAWRASRMPVVDCLRAGAT
jgi:putative ABC transport system permease protein